MADAVQQKLASVPATATMDEVRAMLGHAPVAEPPEAERIAELESFGLTATDLQRINFEIVEVATGTRAFWNADDFAQGAVHESLRSSGVVPAEFGAGVSRAALALLAAAEARAPEFTILLHATLNEPGNGQLVIEWLERHEPAVQTMPLADAAGTPLANEIAALCTALDSAGTAVQGRLSIRTFGPDAQ